MSFFKVTCEKCGAEFYEGVVGSEFVGGHDCPIEGLDTRTAAAWKMTAPPTRQEMERARQHAGDTSVETVVPKT